MLLVLLVSDHSENAPDNIPDNQLLGLGCDEPSAHFLNSLNELLWI